MITPEEAWKHVKALWPDATGLSRDELGTSIHFQNRNSGLNAKIDWPEGVYSWPLQYRVPVIKDDWGVLCEFADELDADEWVQDYLGGYCLHNTCGKWVDSKGIFWVHARIVAKKNDWKPMSTAPKGRNLLLKMGGMALQGFYSDTDKLWKTLLRSNQNYPVSWDVKNQPTGWKEIGE